MTCHVWHDYACTYQCCQFLSRFNDEQFPTRLPISTVKAFDTGDDLSFSTTTSTWTDNTGMNRKGSLVVEPYSRRVSDEGFHDDFCDISQS
jgi:hypothetical protein